MLQNTTPIYQLYTSKSIGISNYTKDIHDKLLGRLDMRLLNVGGSHMLAHMSSDQVLSHVLSKISGLHGVLHVQHDHLMFRGSGDEYDELLGLIKFLKVAIEQFDRVFITFHGHRTYQSVGGDFFEKLQQWILRRKFKKHVAKLLNKCTVFVHSPTHARTLNALNVKTTQLWINPRRRHYPPKDIKPDAPIKLVVPGGMRDYKGVRRAMEVASHVNNCELYVDANDKQQFMQLEYHIKSSNLNVELKPVVWEVDSTKYLKQLAQFDVGLMMFHGDVPLSGSLIDCLRCGLLACSSVTPSFKQFSEQYNCLFCSNDRETIGEWITEHAKNSQTHDMFRINADSYFATSMSSTDVLARQYTGDIVDSVIVSEHQSRNTLVEEDSRCQSRWPNRLINTCKLISAETIVSKCGEHMLLASDTSVLLHGPFDTNHTCGSSHSTDNLLNTISADRQIKMYCTNSTLENLVRACGFEPEVKHLHVIKSSKIFDINCRSRIITDAGWWCRNNGSIYQLNVPVSWSKSKVINVNEPTLELIDFTGEFNNTVDHVNQIESDSIMFIDQITDDVVDDHMLWCISTSTPVLIRRNATTEEYLGSDYVLMFDDIRTAHELLTDDNIKLAHEQLKRI